MSTTTTASPLHELAAATGRGWRAFRTWSHRRPFVGGVLTVVAGVEMFFSGQLDIGKIHVQLGIEGFQATLIPVLLVLLGVLATLMPQHRVFYGVIALALSVYSLVGVNLGGFFIGMLLSAVGGVLIVAWSPEWAERRAVRRAQRAGGASADESTDSEASPFVTRR